jgi:pyruvate/2-oxoglutarate dehydrogenase complex dihydrolipoamide acyltransferase (E2) component
MYCPSSIIRNLRFSAWAGWRKKAVVKEDDAVVIRQMLPLTLCFDHRVTDGAQAARFVRDLKAMLEDPAWCF